ncbi:MULTISPECIES: hypothetical protein [Fictibacillus]|uniref:Uncharacterized protein n=1 Tax=Fictibacillus terranigra TaxID=3058424 RepID=A0ABT8E4Z5_9BACL|nr:MULTISPECIES: hypothetical protein [unclassified Fictibacillus]MDN4072983.1 hypothetical protein [Fictibacillus sp. CENA-BCM004]MED2974231.1 hypothetical protein [Fictibacillus sp. B-59209]
MNILSFKVSASAFTILKIVDFYRLSKAIDSDIYLYKKNGESFRVECIPKIVSFILTIKERDVLLIIVDGINAIKDGERLKQVLC